MFKRLNLSGNALKIIACISMLIAHVGLMFFPRVLFIRYIGRLAFPIFAFLISEGCRYTKNKLRYFLSIFLLGAVCQIAYTIAYPSSVYLGILIAFSFSILIIYSLELVKKSLIEKSKLHVKILSILLFLSEKAIDEAIIAGSNACILILLGLEAKFAPALINSS